nr:retrovirus-related Pol polyprotein from transposon TNT 1-94 [Tanacetum cinerariifolium]
RGTINTGLWYTKDSGFELTGFSDADYAGCKDTFKSTFGGAQFLGKKMVCWSSKKQDCTALSTAEAEYVSLSACCAQVLWMRTQLTDYGFHFNKILIYCDSKSAIAISCNPVHHSRTKHIAVRYHFIKEHVEKGTIELYFVKTDYQLANIFTKALPADRFIYLVRLLGMRSLSPKEIERLAKSQIKRCRYNLIPAELKFKTPMLNHQDKYMMKAQVHVSKSSAISDEQALSRKKHHCQNDKSIKCFGVNAVEDFKEYMLRDYYCWLKTYCCCFGVDAIEDFKEYMLRDYYCWLKTYCCWYKLELLDNVAGSD